MKYKNFEEFLQYKHQENYYGTKDQVVDAWENWVEGLDLDVLLKFGDLYGCEKHLEGLNRVEEILTDV